MAIDGRKLVNYMAHGISPGQIATALNLTPARVTQLAQEPKIAEAVEKRKVQIAEEGLTDVADLKTVKKTLIGRLEDLANGTESLSEAMRALETIDNMTARKLGQEDDNTGIKQVIMQIPIFIQNNMAREDETITLDSRNRIVGIKGRSMAQMPTQGVLEILKGNSHDSEANDSRPQPGELDLSALAIP